MKNSLRKSALEGQALFIIDLPHAMTQILVHHERAQRRLQEADLIDAFLTYYQKIQKIIRKLHEGQVQTWIFTKKHLDLSIDLSQIELLGEIQQLDANGMVKIFVESLQKGEKNCDVDQLLVAKLTRVATLIECDQLAPPTLLFAFSGDKDLLHGYHPFLAIDVPVGVVSLKKESIAQELTTLDILIALEPQKVLHFNKSAFPQLNKPKAEVCPKIPEGTTKEKKQQSTNGSEDLKKKRPLVTDILEEIKALCEAEGNSKPTIKKKCGIFRRMGEAGLKKWDYAEIAQWLEDYISPATGKPLSNRGKKDYIGQIKWYFRRTELNPLASHSSAILDRLQCS